MKEVCGYEDSRGNFHKTEKEAEIAEAKIKVEQVERTLHNFNTFVGQKIFKQHLRASHYDLIQLQNIFCEEILQNSDNLLEIISLKKELEKELDLLKAQANWNPWWARIVWWKD